MSVKHVAVFWLKDSADTERALALMAALAELPQVQGIVTGGPVDHDWPAKKIDKSWHVGCVIELADQDACRDYFNDPRHQNLAGQLRDLSSDVFALYLEY